MTKQRLENRMCTDWSDCEEVERVSGRMNGEPVIKGTRVLAETIVSNFESGSSLEEIHENYPHVPMASICKVLAHHRLKLVA